MSDPTRPSSSTKGLYLPNRRRFLQVSGATVLGLGATRFLAACGSDSDSSSSGGSGGTGGASGDVTTMSIQLSWLKDTEWAPLFLADSNGYYADNGVEVDLVAGGADIGAIEGIVAGGSTDLGIATDITTIVAAIADGNPLVVIGSIYQTNLNTLMSPPDAPILSVEEMQGKRVGGPQGTQIKFDAMFKIAGLDPDYTFVPTGYGPDSLINGDCDVQSGFITDEVLAYKAETGEEPAQLTFQDAGLPAYTLTMFTTKDYLDANRDAIVSFLAATVKGCDDDAADPQAGAELAANVYGKDAGLTVDEEVAKNERYVPLMSSEGTEEHGWLWVDADELSGPIYAGMEAADLATAPVDDVLDMSLLEEAYSKK